MNSFKTAVYHLTRQIPKGRVSTYKDIANALDTAAYRAVGTALKNNPDIPKTPCHRVIKTNGEIGEYAGVGGKKRKEELLKSEGISTHNGRINLEKYCYSFASK